MTNNNPLNLKITMRRFLYFTLVLMCMLSGSIAMYAQNSDQNKGDVNGDGEVNIADVNVLIDAILTGDHGINGDVNEDHEINIADVNALIDIILGGGIDQHLLKVCEKVAEINEVVAEYYMQCESIEELMQHADDIEALDGVEYIFSNDNTTLYVAIKDFGTISYSYYPELEISDTTVIQGTRFEHPLKKTNAQTLYSHQNFGGLLIVNQQSRDENRKFYSERYDNLLAFLNESGFEHSFLEPSPDVEFFRNGLYDYDYVFLITHGGYEFDTNRFEDDPYYRGLHWLLTSEEVLRGADGQLMPTELAALRSTYNESEVSVATIKEKRNGEWTQVSYKKVSNHFIASSNKSFNNPGKAIVFNTACHSMQGPRQDIYEGDSINYSMATAFSKNGAGIYLGYDESNSHGKLAGLQFYYNLLSGMSIKGAFDNLQYDNIHEFLTSGTAGNSSTGYWADLIPHYPDENIYKTCILNPLIQFEDNSTDSELSINLRAESYFKSYNLNYANKPVEDSFSLWSDVLTYGFELSESEYFTDVIRLDEKQIGDENCDLDKNTSIVSFSHSLSYAEFQAEPKIKPNTTYWARAYINDGQGYNYSDAITFTTGTIVDETPQTETFTCNGVSFTMVTVEGGTFTMGDANGDGWDGERPTHQVTLSSFAIGQTEVTQALWKAVMGNNPSYFNSDSSNPVEQISWHDCQQFIFELNKLTGRNFRLPTDAECEFASRGGIKSNNYKYSGSNVINDVAWYDGNSNNKTHPVASKAPNELGLYDMSGNVWEWCQDYFGNYNSEPQTNPMGPEDGSNRVMRGGSYDFSDYFCRVAHRNYDNPSQKSPHLGMRLVLDDVFSLSVSTIDLIVGEETTVLILNGSGQYAVTGDAGVVDAKIQGNQLLLSAKSVGTARLIVSDLTKGVNTTLLVNVTLNKTFTVNGVSFSMVPVEGGTFLMGASSDDTEAETNEKPAHQVTLSNYYVGQTEVTRGLWLAVMGGRPDDYWGLNKPKVFVTWLECQSFINKLNGMTGMQFRLLTEAEWEFAARGGNKSMGYKYSGSNNIDDVAWYRENAWYVDDSGSRPVATKAPNELGLYDMTGNVSEWVNDWYGYYSSSAQTNPSGPATGTYRVFRGGSYFNAAKDSRVTYRSGGAESYSGEIVGFRLAL